MVTNLRGGMRHSLQRMLLFFSFYKQWQKKDQMYSKSHLSYKCSPWPWLYIRKIFLELSYYWYVAHILNQLNQTYSLHTSLSTFYTHTHTHTWNNWGEDVSLPECNMVINTKQTTSLIAEINPQGNKHHCLKVCNSHPVQPQCLVPVWSYPVPPLANIIVS